ncbi:MAG: deoxycytidylate deaminase, partial [Candidatus Margulisiibacteriota bacterium]
MNRPSWDDYFMKITQVVSERATCVKRKVGAIIVKENRILSTGYNGAPKGFVHCTEETCLRKKYNVPSGQRHELCRGLHAEQNAIIQAAWHGVKIEGGTLYCTYQPCVICVKMMINAGIIKLVYAGPYPDELAKQMLEESTLEIVRYEGALEPENELLG